MAQSPLATTVVNSQLTKAKAFAALHREGKCFLLPNAWDRGSLKLLEAMGFAAIATTGAGYDLCAGTSLPVSGDLQNGFGVEPRQAARTVLDAAGCGLVGGSIEDTGGPDPGHIYDIGLARERVIAAVEAARSLDFPFTLTARAENYYCGKPDLADTIHRLQVYQEAGADVLYSPGVRSLDELREICGAVDRPVNVLMGMRICSALACAGSV
jgi:2-methylisocitrate lyase-like PEP mutase family enzyme